MGLLQIKPFCEFLIMSLDGQSTLLSGPYLGEELLDFNAGSVQLRYSRHCHTVSQGECVFLWPRQQCVRVPVSLHTTTLVS